MEYLRVGNTAHISEFSGDFDELIHYLPAETLNSLEILGIKRICWGLEGEDWRYIEDFPRLEP